MRIVPFNNGDLLQIKQQILEISCDKPKELFCGAVVFRSDCKEFRLSRSCLLSVLGQQQIDK